MPARQPSANRRPEQVQQCAWTRLRCGRDVSYLAPPAQIRTCSFPAYGSHSGIDGRCRNGFRAFPDRESSKFTFTQRFAVCEPAPLTRLCGSESGACFADPHFPWSPPLAPLAPQRIAPLCSSASQLLWQGQTSRVRASSATAPRLPDADRRTHATLTVRHETSQLPMRSFCT
jgi:hypothetical protein